VTIPDIEGCPGRSVYIPLHLANDSPVVAFQFLVHFDADLFEPVRIYDTTFDIQGGVIAVDSSFVDCRTEGRFPSQAAQRFNVSLFHDRGDVVACNFLSGFEEDIPIPGGDGPIAGVKFFLSGSVPHGETIEIGYYQEPVFVVDSSVNPPETTFFDACWTSQLVILWSDSLRYDMNPGAGEMIRVPTPYQRYPVLVEGSLRADTGLACCVGITGNVDGDPDEIVDIGDLTALIDYLFLTYTPPDCMEEANTNGDPEGIVDIGDLTALIDYLFITYTPPAECP